MSDTKSSAPSGGTVPRRDLIEAHIATELLRQLAANDQLPMDIEARAPGGLRWHCMELRLTQGGLREPGC